MLGVNITKILNAFFEHGYDKRVRPNYGGELHALRLYDPRLLYHRETYHVLSACVPGLTFIRPNARS